MRAVVTGGAGFIGSHLIDVLRAEVFNVDRVVGRPIEETYLDFDRVDVIFHLASPVGPVGVIHESGRIVSQVIHCAEIVRSWALRYGCPLVYVSTSEVYGSGDQDSETDACHFGPDTSARKEYAIAKLAAETMLRNSAGLDVRIVRPFNVAGPRQRIEGGFVLPRFIAQARAGTPLTVYLPGTQRRAFGHVLDVAEGIRAAYTHGSPGEVYNLGNPANTTDIRSLAETVLDVLKVPSRIELVDPVTLHGPAFREAPDKLPNIDKAVRELNWRPTRSLTDIIEDAALVAV